MKTINTSPAAPKSFSSLLVIIAIALALSVGIWYLLEQTKSPLKYAGATDTIVFGVETSLLTAPIWIAENKGYFQEQGINVEIKEFDSGRAALTAMLKEGNPDNLDMVTAAQTPVMFNSFERDDYAIISTMVTSTNEQRILARKNSGILSPADLKGKKVGVTKSSTGHYFLHLFLANHKLADADVEMVGLKTGELVQAIVDGKVDAISTWEPHLSNSKKQLAENGLLMEVNYLLRTDFYFIPNKDLIASNPEVLEKFLRAIEQAEQFIEDNRVEAVTIVSERLKLDKAQVDALWDNYNYQLALDQSILRTLENEAQWAMENNLTAATKVPDYRNYISAEALKKVKPEAVKIIIPVDIRI